MYVNTKPNILKARTPKFAPILSHGLDYENLNSTLSLFGGAGVPKYKFLYFFDMTGLWAVFGTTITV